MSLDDRDTQAEAAIRRAAVETLKAQIEAASIELVQVGNALKRATELVAIHTISEQEATHRRFAHDLAQARKAILIAQSGGHAGYASPLRLAVKDGRFLARAAGGCLHRRVMDDAPFRESTPFAGAC